MSAHLCLRCGHSALLHREDPQHQQIVPEDVDKTGCTHKRVGSGRTILTCPCTALALTTADLAAAPEAS